MPTATGLGRRLLVAAAEGGLCSRASPSASGPGCQESLRRQVGLANGQTDGGREGKGVAAAPGEEGGSPARTLRSRGLGGTR